MDENSKMTLIGLAVETTMAIVAKSSASPDGVPAILRSVHGTLVDLFNEEPAPKVDDETGLPAPGDPAVPIRKSVQPDYIVCLEDGKKFKSLKRHLMSAYGLTPDQYRKRWNLPADFPMVAPNYSAQRSQLAKDMGLGTK